MQKTLLIFIISALVLITLSVWAVNMRGNITDIVAVSIVVLLAGFGLYLGISRLKSIKKKEAMEDELTKTIMIKASSYAFYISLYLWLLIMYFSDKTSLESHSLIGAGIAGMALIFLISWIAIKIFGIKSV
jgi:hypothetical protein